MEKSVSQLSTVYHCDKFLLCRNPEQIRASLVEQVRVKARRIHSQRVKTTVATGRREIDGITAKKA